MISQAKNLLLREVTCAPEAWKLLDGYFCLYKPTCKGFARTRDALLRKLVQELNSMDCRPPRQRVVISGDVSSGFQVSMQTNLADHVLVSGPRYKEEYIPLWLGNHPGWHSSGVVLGIIGPSISKLKSRFMKQSFPKLYQIQGRFGLATNDFFENGKVIAKSTYKHLRRDKFESVICKIEATQRQQIYKSSGVTLESEDAYKIATTGWVPPANGSVFPLIYEIRVTSFQLPDFSIELQCLNENEQFLAEFINEIGLAMKSTAVCTGIRLVKFGPFGVEHSLLKKNWDLQNLIENIQLCNKLVPKI